jgi:hypothetical protein
MVAAVLVGVSVGLLAFAIGWWRASGRDNAAGTP